MRATNTIILASGNNDKLREMREIMSAYPDLEIKPAGEFLSNPDKIGAVENFDTYAGNAAAKARFVNRAAHYPALADDTGLEVEALGGRPGARSHRFAGLPQDSIPSRAAQDRANLEKLLTELKNLPHARRSAKFVCELALVLEGLRLTARGELHGTIAEAPRGTNGFGYDSLFIPRGSQRTLAEMTNAEKNAISHRAKAAHELMAAIKAKGIVLVKP